ncbi:MAG: hypothetical protein R3346_03250 [Candidatus Spechtbacterales bacterium]|nr:hypothetical protein [Candidatus Spechtbacterales bacterium]
MANATDEELGKISRQWMELFRRVREGSLDTDYVSRGLQAIIEQKTPSYHSQIFTVEVDYAKLVSEYLKDDVYDFANEYLTDDNFPPAMNPGSRKPCTCHSVKQVNMHLINFGRKITSEEIERELNMHGLRPAVIQELLAFGIANPFLYTRITCTSIFTLGSALIDFGGHRRTPYIYGSSSSPVKRGASLDWFINDHEPDEYCLAVRK